jgi:hypothetical protein
MALPLMLAAKRRRKRFLVTVAVKGWPHWPLRVAAVRCAILSAYVAPMPATWPSAAAAALVWGMA